MLETPYIIKENKCKIEDLYADNEFYVKVYLDSNGLDDGFIPIIVNNQIVKAIFEKYTEKTDFIKSIIYEDLNEFDWDKPMFYSDFLVDIQKEFKNIDIFFMDYEKLDLNVRKYVNNLIRCDCVCSDGKLLFHIVSELRYKDFVKQGYRFDTYCDEEILMYGHEIQTLQIHNEIIVDDFYLKMG